MTLNPPSLLPVPKRERTFLALHPTFSKRLHFSAHTHYSGQGVGSSLARYIESVAEPILVPLVQVSLLAFHLNYLGGFWYIRVTREKTGHSLRGGLVVVVDPVGRRKYEVTQKVVARGLEDCNLLGSCRDLGIFSDPVLSDFLGGWDAAR